MIGPVFAVAALWLGPLLAPALRRLPPLRAALDGLLLVAIAGLVLLEILPASIAQAGGAALAAAAAGLVLPRLAEGALRQPHARVHRLLLALALCGLLVHAASDGVALALDRAGASAQPLAAAAPAVPAHGARAGEPVAAGPGQPSLAEGGHAHGTGGALTLAVVLHQVPVGLLLWVSLGVRFGLALALVALAAMSAATLLGYFGVVAPEAVLGPFGAGLLMAFVGGSLLHVVAGHEHRARPRAAAATSRQLGLRGEEPAQDTPHEPAARPLWSGLGGVLALLLLAGVLGRLGETGPAPAVQTLLALYFASAPALLLGFVLAGLAHAYLPYASLRWLGRGGTLAQAARGVVVGLPLPVCSCGVVPLYDSLIRRGAPPAAALAFLVATPELGIDALLISFPLLGPELTLARLAVALLSALAVGVLVARFAAPPGGSPARLSEAPIDTPPPRGAGRLRLALRHGLATSVERLMPWMVVGLVLAALAAPLFDPEWLRRLPPGLDVPLCALLGMPIYVCATGATPLAAVLIARGISPGAAIAFLLTGPATNATTFGVLSRLHGRAAAAALGGVVLAASVGLGWAANALLPARAWRGAALELHEHGAGALELAAGAILAALLLWRLLVCGPRALLRELAFARAGEPALAPPGGGGGAMEARAACCPPVPASSGPAGSCCDR